MADRPAAQAKSALGEGDTEAVDVLRRLLRRVRHTDVVSHRRMGDPSRVIFSRFFATYRKLVGMADVLVDWSTPNRASSSERRALDASSCPFSCHGHDAWLTTFVRSGPAVAG
jgi:hypothetical protein